MIDPYQQFPCFGVRSIGVIMIYVSRCVHAGVADGAAVGRRAAAGGRGGAGGGGGGVRAARRAQCGARRRRAETAPARAQAAARATDALSTQVLHVFLVCIVVLRLTVKDIFNRWMMMHA